MPAMTMKKNGNTDAETFVREWQKAINVQAFCARTGLAKGSAHARASLLRRRGIPLKKFPRGQGRRALDVSALAKLARSLAA